MKRTAGIERVYSLGQFKSLRVIDTIEEVPEEFVLDTEFMDALRKYQLADVELTYQRYVQMGEKVARYNEGSEEKFVELLEERIHAWDELQKLLNKKQE